MKKNCLLLHKVNDITDESSKGTDFMNSCTITAKMAYLPNEVSNLANHFVKLKNIKNTVVAKV